MQNQIQKTLKLLNLVERLKFELRHSWTSNGRQESVAEHSWRLSLMVILMSQHLKEKVDLEKCIKMAVIHDIVEAEAGDIPVFDITESLKEQKELRERQAIDNIKSMLDNELGHEIHDLWHEFEKQESYEAKFVHALDKLECKLQHIEADIGTWNEKELAMSFDWDCDFYHFDPAISLLHDMLKEETVNKILAHNPLAAV